MVYLIQNFTITIDIEVHSFDRSTSGAPPKIGRFGPHADRLYSGDQIKNQVKNPHKNKKPHTRTRARRSRSRSATSRVANPASP